MIFGLAALSLILHCRARRRVQVMADPEGPRTLMPGVNA
jgi:hypothetical protein